MAYNFRIQLMKWCVSQRGTGFGHRLCVCVLLCFVVVTETEKFFPGCPLNVFTNHSPTNLSFHDEDEIPGTRVRGEEFAKKREKDTGWSSRLLLRLPETASLK